MQKSKSKLHYSAKNMQRICDILHDIRIVYKARQVVAAMDQI